jgi:hypothetical protein
MAKELTGPCIAFAASGEIILFQIEAAFPKKLKAAFGFRSLPAREQVPAFAKECFERRSGGACGIGRCERGPINPTGPRHVANQREDETTSEKGGYSHGPETFRKISRSGSSTAGK